MKTQFKNGLTGNWLVMENNVLTIHAEKQEDAEVVDNPMSHKEPTETPKQHAKAEKLLVEYINQNNK